MASPFIPGLGTPESSPGRGGMPSHGWHPSDYAAGAPPRPPMEHRRTGSFGASAYQRGVTPEMYPSGLPGAGGYGAQPAAGYGYGGPAPYPSPHAYGGPPPLAGGYGPPPPPPLHDPYARGGFGPPPPPAHYGAGYGAGAMVGRGRDGFADEPPPLMPGGYGAGGYADRGYADRPGYADRAGPGYAPAYADYPGFADRPGPPGFADRPGFPDRGYSDPRFMSQPYGYDDRALGPSRPLGPAGNEEDSLDMRRLRWQPDFDKYTRVLPKQVVQMHGIKLELHPFIRSSRDGPMNMAAEVGEEGHVRWDMRLRISSASFSSGPSTRAWNKGRTAPATFPPTTDLIIVSRSFPWSIPVHDASVITVGGLMDALDIAMHMRVTEQELRSQGNETSKRVGAAYHANRKELRGVLMDGLLRCDMLMDRCEFGGFMTDEQLVMERMNVPNMTTAIALVCEPRGLPALGGPGY